MLQAVESSLQVIYQNFYLSIAQDITKITGRVRSLTNKGSTAKLAVLTATPGCGRDATGYARLEFAVSYNNISKEGVGVAAGRKLLTTPCSSTDGTTVSRKGCRLPDSCALHVSC